MEKTIMNKTTFGEICKILKDGKCDFQECVNGVFEIALLFFPGIICKDMAFITNVVNGATILGAKPVIEKSIKNIEKVFTKKEYTDFSTKYEHAQIAQVLIVFAAYFDSIKLYLPDEERKIQISPKEKQILTDNSISQYVNLIKTNLSKSAEQNAREIFEYNLAIPNPVEGRAVYLNQLKKFYEILNREFQQFYEKLSFFEEMEENKREQFLTVIRGLPDKAVENYQKQYYQLAVNFNDFFIWTNIEDHKKIQEKLDVGFAEISKKIADYIEKSADSKAKSTMEKYKIKYESYIETPVVNVSEMGYCSTDEVIFPNKSEIFIPQSFKALTYKNGIHLEDRKTWKNYDGRDDIGKFVSDILRHSITGSFPLLILGHPGAGKSLLCNMLAARILQHEYHVIIVNLRDTVADQTVSQQINQQIERDFSNGCTWNDIAESGLEKPILIIFDGYDELLQASGKAYSDYIQRIAEFQDEQKKYYGIFVKCIVTSRITLIDKASIPNNSPVIMLSDFDEERINQWCQIWNEKNKDYFIGANLEKFEIDSSSKVSELSKQPLLLLMLALYDSNDNALKRNKDLNETKLYDNLIREFISREKRKEKKFKSLLPKEQDSIINEEMIKISIAALGMYNRKILYIRSNELENDLQFILRENDTSNDVKIGELSESDKLLGSFFFIHKSNSTDIVDREKISNAAYEFLHNTFGEFLTANYIVNKLDEVLSWVNMLVEKNRQREWKLCNQRAWVICMAYTPLFSRPVVVRMIHEWASGYFCNKNIEAIDDDLDTLLNIEIENIVSGNILFDLKEVMEEKNNPYSHDGFLKHLAIYSINLFIIRTIVFHNKYGFKYDEERWNKLLNIWKYAFSEDELLNFANQFSTNRFGDVYEVSYKLHSGSIFQSQVEKYFRINSAIGDSVLYGIMGALIGENVRDKVIVAIDNNQLNISARYLWNNFLNGLVNSKYAQADLIDKVCEIIVASWKEKDVQYILCSHILIDYLLKKRIIKKDEKNNYKIIRVIMCFAENVGYLKYDFRRGIACVFDIVSNLLDYVKLDDENIAILLRCLIGVQHSFYEDNEYGILNMTNKILRKALKKGGKLSVSGMRDYVGFYLERMMYGIREQQSISSKLVTDFLEFVNDYMILDGHTGRKRIEDIYSRVEEVLCDYCRKKKLSFEQKMLTIKSLYIIFSKKTQHKQVMNSIFFYEVLCPIDVKKLYDNDPDIFYNLLVLINNHLSDSKDFYISDNIIQLPDFKEYFKKDIIWVVEHRGEQLSLMNYRQIKIFAQNINSDGLLDSLERLWI